MDIPTCVKGFCSGNDMQRVRTESPENDDERGCRGLDQPGCEVVGKEPNGLPRFVQALTKPETLEASSSAQIRKLCDHRAITALSGMRKR